MYLIFDTFIWFDCFNVVFIYVGDGVFLFGVVVLLLSGLICIVCLDLIFVFVLLLNWIWLIVWV